MNTPAPTPDPHLDYVELSRQIKRWGQELGFQQVGITVLMLLMGLAFWNDLSRQWSHLLEWMSANAGP